MKGKMWGNEYRTTVVCVDAYEDGVLSGRLYNPALTGGTQFRSVMDFLIKMEDLLDRAINQNYVPVVDDQGYFIGIITRKAIIRYCREKLFPED